MDIKERNLISYHDLKLAIEASTRQPRHNSLLYHFEKHYMGILLLILVFGSSGDAMYSRKTFRNNRTRIEILKRIHDRH